MSSSNFRGLRSPWSVLLLATVFLAFVVAGIVMGLTEKGTSTAGIAVIVVVFGAASAFIYYIGFRRLSWMRAHGINTLRPEVGNERSNWGRMLPPDEK